jgi:hypothetical protein
MTTGKSSKASLARASEHVMTESWKKAPAANATPWLQIQFLELQLEHGAVFASKIKQSHYAHQLRKC